MIIQCEQCRTKFRLDDSKVKDKGVKVRCAKCRHVFTVTKEQSEPQQPSDFEVILDQAPAFSEAAPPDVFSSRREEGTVPGSQRQQNMEASFSSDQTKPVSAADIDFSAFGVDDAQPAMAITPRETAPFTPGEIDFGNVDFSSAPDDPFAENVTSPAVPCSDSTPPELPSKVELDLQFNDLAGISGNQDFSGTNETTKPVSLDKPFSTDEIDFGEDPVAVSVQREQPEESKSIREFTFTAPEGSGGPVPPPATTEPRPVEPPPMPPVAPQPEIKPAPAQPGIVEPDFGQPSPAVDEAELPPLCIPSRRKQSSLLKFFMALLVIAIIGGLGYYGKDLYPWLKQQTAQETGKITVRSIKSSFVKNTTTGNELLVISGEAINGFTTPRAALRVKGVVYGDKGEVLVSKNIYCGNPLSAEQLATMPLAAIEAAMANQLGSALMNLEVAPGKAIPFTVVISTIPAGAKDFGVDPEGSQSVAEKQK